MTTYDDPRFSDRSTTPLRVFKRDGEVIEFETPFANLREVAEILETRLADNAFAQSLLRSIQDLRGPSPKQAAWAHKLAVDAITVREQSRRPLDSDVDLLPILDLLHGAAAAQKVLPKIRLQVDSKPVVITLAGPKSKNAGGAYISDGGPYGENIFYGSIRPDGSFRRTPAVTLPMVTLLRELAAEPARIAAQHGVATGCCSFCGRGLTTKESRSVGYGPICAERYGLPWGAVSEEVEAADRAARKAATR